MSDYKKPWDLPMLCFIQQLQVGSSMNFQISRLPRFFFSKTTTKTQYTILGNFQLRSQMWKKQGLTESILQCKNQNKTNLAKLEVYRNIDFQSCLAVRSGKKSSNQETGLGNRGHMKRLNNTKLISNDSGGSLMLIQDKFGIIQNLQTSPIPTASFLTGIFLPLLTAKRL